MPYLLLQEDNTRRIFVLADDVMNLGGAAHSDIRMDHPSCADARCRFIKTGAGYKILKLHAPSGLFINDRQMDEAILKDGDIVRLGDVRLCYLVDRPAEDSQGVSPPIMMMHDPKTSLLLETILSSIRHETIEQFLPVLLDNLIAIFDAERGMVMFANESDNDFSISFARDNMGCTIEGVSDFSRSIPKDVMHSAKPVFIRDTKQHPPEELPPSIRLYELMSVMCVPLKIGDKVLGALYLDSHATVKDFNREEQSLLQLAANHIVLAFENMKMQEERRLAELSQRETLERENLLLRSKIENQHHVSGRCPAMRRVYEQIRHAAPTDAIVLIEGESGTGKEALAKLLHDLSPRGHAPWVIVDCASIPETLLESELFGYEIGAFTGATSQKLGKFECAQGGTVFLDEIGELPLVLQAKIMRFLQEKELTRVGGIQPIRVDARVVAATNRNLMEMVKQKAFREDLYYRLHVVKIAVPPLRERGNDIALLAEYFLKEACERYGKRLKRFSAETRDGLLRHAWPGNVRELKHRIERAVIMTNRDRPTLEDLELRPEAGGRTLEEARRQFEKAFIMDALTAHGHNVNQTAMGLGISRQHLHNLIKKHDL